MGRRLTDQQVKRWRQLWMEDVLRSTYARVAFWMQDWLDDEPDLNPTELAEGAVDEFNLRDKLLDGDTWLTDLAVTVDYRRD